MIAALCNNAKAGFLHLEAFTGAKTLSGFVEMQLFIYLRSRVEQNVEPAKEF